MNKKNTLNYKAISPVVATALLLVVAVIAVVGFQTFFNTYSTGLFSKVETQSTGSVGNTQIDTISGGMLYFKSGFEDIDIQSVKVNGNDCYVSGSYDLNLNSIPMSNCTNSGENEVVFVTNKGVYEKKIYKNNADYSDPCPSGYIIVPGNVDLGTKNFCVMKFEAKNVSNIATSQGVLTPWVSINQTDSKAKCEALGTNYHLITNAEWMTIARNIEQVSTNWNSSVVGSGFLFSGHNDNGPASALAVTDENDYYVGTNDGVSSPGDGLFNNFPSNDARAYMGQKRVLILNNGEIIWDLSGNVWEWNNDTIDCSAGYPCANMPYDSTPAEELIEFIAVSIYGSFTYDFLRPSNSLWDANYSVGRLYTDANSAFPSGSTHALLRGGDRVLGANAGAFSLLLQDGPSAANAVIGFRCVYNP